MLHNKFTLQYIAWASSSVPNFLDLWPFIWRTWTSWFLSECLFKNFEYFLSGHFVFELKKFRWFQLPWYIFTFFGESTHAPILNFRNLQKAVLWSHWCWYCIIGWILYKHRYPQVSAILWYSVKRIKSTSWFFWKPWWIF